MAIDFSTGAFQYNNGCVVLSAITLAALRDTWSWKKAALYSTAACVGSSWAIHLAKATPWQPPGFIAPVTKGMKPADFYKMFTKTAVSVPKIKARTADPECRHNPRALQGAVPKIRP
jgi:hypothetical protein